MANNLQDARKAWKDFSDKYKIKKAYRYVVTGDGSGNLFYERDNRYIWARSYNSLNKPFPVLNRGKIGPYLNLPIIVGYEDEEPDKEQVIAINYDAFPSGFGGSAAYGIGPHATQHMFGGGDEVWVDSRLFLPGLVRATNPISMAVRIEPFMFYHSGQLKRFGGSTTKLLSEYLPNGANTRYLTLAVDPANGSVVYRPSNEISLTGQLTWDALISGTASASFDLVGDPVGGEIVLASIWLTSATSAIEWTGTASNLFDTRNFLTQNYFDLEERVNALEGYIGNSFSLPAVGAQKSATDELKTNAWALQNTPVSISRPIANSLLAYDIATNMWSPSVVKITRTINITPTSSNNVVPVQPTDSASTIATYWHLPVNSQLFFNTVFPSIQGAAASFIFYLEQSDIQSANINFHLHGVSGSQGENSQLDTFGMSSQFGTETTTTIQKITLPMGNSASPNGAAAFALSRYNVTTGTEYDVANLANVFGFGIEYTT